MSFQETFFAGWGDMDFNSHMRNTAFLDKAADIRMKYFAAHGFPMQAFLKQRIGPVVMKDEVEYFREIHLLENFQVNFTLAGLAPDGSRMILRNEFTRADGRLAARINSAGGWLDLQARRLSAPPPALLQALQGLDRTADFQELASSLTAE